MGVIEVVMDCIDVMLEWTPEDLSLQYYRLRSLLCCMLGSECVVSYPSEVERRMREQLGRLEGVVCSLSECGCVGEACSSSGVCSSNESECSGDCEEDACSGDCEEDACSGDCEEDACSSDDDVCSSSEVSEEEVETASRIPWCLSLFSLLIMVLLLLGACWTPCRLEEGEVVCWSGGLRVVDENMTQVREETEMEWSVPEEESGIVEEEKSETVEENELTEEKSEAIKESENQIVEEKSETDEESEKTETETDEENDAEREMVEKVEKNEQTEMDEESENQIVEEKNETNEAIETIEKTETLNTNEPTEESTEKENNTTSEDGDMTQEKNGTDEENDTTEANDTAEENQTQEQLPPNTLISSSLLHFLRPHWFLLLTSSSLLLFVTWWLNRETVETVELEEEVSTPQQDSFEGDSAMEVTRNMDDETYHSLLRILVKWVFGLSLTTRSQTPRKAQ